MLRRPRAVARALSLVLGLSLVAPVAGAQPAPRSSPERVQRLEQQITEASASEAAALRALSDIQGRRAVYDARVRTLDADIARTDARLGEAQVELARQVAAVERFDSRIESATTDIDGTRRRIEEAARALYVSRGATIDDLFFEPSSAGTMFAGSRYLERLADRRESEIDRLDAVRQDLEALREQVEVGRRKAAATESMIANEREHLTGLRRRHLRERDRLRSEEAAEARAVASFRARKDEFTAELDTLRAQSNAIGKQLADRQATQPAAASGRSFIAVRPVPGGISSPFGYRRHPILGTTRLHAGVDLQAGYGTPIRAVASGVVESAGWRGGYGNAVVIDHGNRYSTLYGHASRLLVSAGEPVTAGQVVAAAGSTGMSTAPHLHFEVRLLGVPKNPVPFL